MVCCKRCTCGSGCVDLTQRLWLARMINSLFGRRGMRAPLGWLFPFRDHRNFGLDAFGLEIWEACDGGRTVEAICEGFAERHQVSFEEARGAINQFLHILLLKDLIFIEVPATPEELS